MSKQYTVTQINTKLVVTVEAEDAREAAIKGGKILGIRYGSQPTAGRQRKSGHNSATTEVWSVGRKGCNILRDNYAVTEVVETAEVETAPTATFIAEYIWTFTPTADGKTLWNSERVR